MCSDHRLASVAALLLGGLAPGQQHERIAPDDALRRAFPGCVIERAPVHLDAALRERAGRRAGTPESRGIAFRWIARRDGTYAGSGWFDTHKVRTLRETLLLAVGPDHVLREVVVIDFGEPPDYLPRPRFYDQFHGRRLDDELDLARGIDGVSGATLTSRATTRAARRALALEHEVPPPEAWPPELCAAATAAARGAEQRLTERWRDAAPQRIAFVLDEARLQAWDQATGGIARDGVVTAYARRAGGPPEAYVDTAPAAGAPAAFLVLPPRGADAPAEVVALTDPPGSAAARTRAERRCVALDRLLAGPR